MTSPEPVVSSMPMDLVSAEVLSIVANAQRLGLTWELLPATVQGPGTRSVPIRYDGDTVPVTAISLVGPLVSGVRVYAMRIPPSGNFIIGFVTMPGFVDGVNVTTSGAIVATVSAETDISQLALSGTVKAGYAYLIAVQIVNTVTTTTDDWNMNVRRDTAVTGPVLARAQWSGDDVVGTHYFTWPFVATVDETLSLFFSVVRGAGGGTISVFGAEVGSINRTMSFLALSAPSSLWRTT